MRTLSHLVCVVVSLFSHLLTGGQVSLADSWLAFAASNNDESKSKAIEILNSILRLK